MSYQPQSDPCPEKCNLLKLAIAHSSTEDGEKKCAKHMKDALERDKFEVTTLDNANDLTKITWSIKQCRKCIIVASRSFLQSREYKEVMECISKKTALEDRGCLIVVLSGLTKEDLPEELQILSGDAEPVICIDNSDYWPQLKERIHEERPILSTSTDGIAYGLGWAYYCGYLFLILPALKLRIIEEYERSKNDWTCGSDAILFPKLVAIIPKKRQVILENGERKKDLSEYDSNIQILQSKTTGDPVKVAFKVDFPGHPQKDYSLTLHKLTFCGKEYIFSAELPTILNTLAMITMFNCVEFSDQDYEREVSRFCVRLDQILRINTDDYSQSRRENLKILKFDDGDNLGEILAGGIHTDLEWERAPWRMN